MKWTFDRHLCQAISRLLLLFVLLVQCATPTQPSGGPPDRTPPKVMATEPSEGTTLFDGDRIRFHFSKYINRRSFNEAFRMEPDLLLDYEISWRRRSATVHFRDPLPENRTVIFTLGTDLSDTRNNRITQPYQLALSTGPEIDSGRITARVRDALTGENMTGERILLYRYPVNLGEGADYVGESDTAGVVRFNYLAEGDYLAFWLDDRNRNRRWDRRREAAQPFTVDTVRLEKEADLDIGSIFVVRRDTLPPALQAVGMLSEVRLRLRFSDDVRFDGDSSIRVTPADDSQWIPVVPLYVDRESPNILMAQSSVPLPDDGEYRIEIAGITDITGNEARSEVDLFPGSDDPDTTFARFISHDTQAGFFQDEPAVIRYARLLDNEPSILDSLIVIESQTTHKPWPHARIQDNLLFICPDEAWQQGASYEFRIWDGERMDRLSITPRIIFRQDLGAIEIRTESPVTSVSTGESAVSDNNLSGESDVSEYNSTEEPGASDNKAEGETGTTDQKRYRYELITRDGEEIRSGSFRRETLLDGIPPGTYLLRVYEVGESRRYWDPGRVDPFRPPGRYFIRRNVPVERGLTSQVTVEWQHLE